MKNKYLVDSMILLDEVNVLVNKSKDERDLKKYTDFKNSLEGYLKGVKDRYDFKYDSTYRKSFDIFYNAIIKDVKKSIVYDLENLNSDRASKYINQIKNDNFDLYTLNESRLLIEIHKN